MSTNEKILHHLERMGWVAIYIDDVKLGPGRDNWQSPLLIEAFYLLNNN